MIPVTTDLDSFRSPDLKSAEFFSRLLGRANDEPSRTKLYLCDQLSGEWKDAIPLRDIIAKNIPADAQQTEHDDDPSVDDILWFDQSAARAKGVAVPQRVSNVLVDMTALRRLVRGRQTSNSEVAFPRRMTGGAAAPQPEAGGKSPPLMPSSTRGPKGKVTRAAIAAMMEHVQKAVRYEQDIDRTLRPKSPAWPFANCPADARQSDEQLLPVAPGYRVPALRRADYGDDGSSRHPPAAAEPMTCRDIATRSNFECHAME